MRNNQERIKITTGTLLVLLCLILSSALIISCESIEGRNGEDNILPNDRTGADITLKYPYSIPRKSETELKEIERKFNELNEGHWFIGLNPYTGLVASASTVNLKEVLTSPTKEEAKQIVNDFLIKNKVFLGLKDSFYLEEDQEEGMDYEYTFRVKPDQTFNRLEISAVDQEAKRVLDDGYKNRVRLLHFSNPNRHTNRPHLELYIYEWSRYPQIKAPTKPNLSKREAIAKLKAHLGKSGDSHLKKGLLTKDSHHEVQPPQELVEALKERERYELSPQDFTGKDISIDVKKYGFTKAKLIILPIADNNQDNKLVFRLCWQIEIDFWDPWGIMKEEYKVGFYSAYVDAITGEVVYIRPNFVE